MWTHPQIMPRFLEPEKCGHSRPSRLSRNQERFFTHSLWRRPVKESKGYVLEIQGFTDKTGNDRYNLGLSQGRSESVVRYLSQQHQIPLFRMFILGLGSSKEVETNKTRKGRAANRRVEITLLKSELESTPSGSAQK
jgi:hypothetical protein